MVHNPLSVENLTKRFGGMTAVENVSLELRPGIVTGLVGPNGAGKTTLFNLITGNLPADGGVVHINGRQATGLAPHVIARLGVARSFQDLRLFGGLTVRDNVLAATENSSWPWQGGGSRAARERQQATDAAIERVGLTHVAKIQASDISYAEAKFLSLARILATGAKIWLLDEPASGLDPSSSQRFVRLLKDATAQGVTICLIEHNLDLMKATADRLAFLEQGRLLALGSVDEILRDQELVAIYFGDKSNAA